MSFLPLPFLNFSDASSHRSRETSFCCFDFMSVIIQQVYLKLFIKYCVYNLLKKFFSWQSVFFFFLLFLICFPWTCFKCKYLLEPSYSWALYEYEVPMNNSFLLFVSEMAQGTEITSWRCVGTTVIGVLGVVLLPDHKLEWNVRLLATKARVWLFLLCFLK